MPIENKIAYLNEVKDKCIQMASEYQRKYKRLKWKDDLLDVTTTCMNSGVIALTLSGIIIPPLLIVSASLSGTSFILSQGQRTYNLKRKYITHDMTYKQYLDLQRKIEAVLQRNHMTGEEYDQFIDQVNDRIALIDDARII